MTAIATRANIAPRQLSGVHFVPATPYQNEDIGPDDVLRVDFDSRGVDRDGLYLIEAMGPDGVGWIGCRQFAASPDGAQVMDGGRWQRVPQGLRIAGRVLQVYKSGTKREMKTC